MAIKVGCYGFPKGMGKYFQEFRLVEVQQTFYRPPKVETAVRWRALAPPGFEFTVKACQVITHAPGSPTYRRAGVEIPAGDVDKYGFFRPSHQVREAWDRTGEVAAALDAQVVLSQSPPSFRPTDENIENMLQFFRGANRDRFRSVWEPRGGWDRKTIETLCLELGLVHGVDPFLEEPVQGALRYFRMHGGPGYRHQYTDDELSWLQGQCRGETYCLFNNLSMWEDARRFRRLVAATFLQAQTESPR